MITTYSTRVQAPISSLDNSTSDDATAPNPLRRDVADDGSDRRRNQKTQKTKYIVV